jgi:hypothetical protein
LFVSFIPGALNVDDWSPGNEPDAPQQPPFEVKLRPFQLEKNPTKGLTRNSPSRLNERWRPRITNGKIADAWGAVKYMTVFVAKMFDARESSENP